MSCPLVPITARLFNYSEWAAFEAQTVEMIVSVKGNYIAPMPVYYVSNLDANKKYHIFMRFDQISNTKFHYSKVMEKWVEEKTEVQPEPEVLIPHESGIQTGDYWLDKTVSFHVRLTNNRKVADEHDYNVFLHSGVKYRPVIIVAEITADESDIVGSAQEFYYPCTEFMASTVYHAAEVKNLKRGRNYQTAGTTDAANEEGTSAKVAHIDANSTDLAADSVCTSTTYLSSPDETL